MNIGVVLIHDKGEEANEAQIDTLLSLFTPVLDDGTKAHFGYTIKNVVGHEFFVIQIVPKNTPRPSNIDSLQCLSKVFYGNDQPATDGQFYNWAVSRGFGQYGLDAVIQINDISQFTVSNINLTIAKLSNGDFLEGEPYGVITTPKFYQNVKPFFDDSKPYDELIVTYKEEDAKEGEK